MFVCVVIEIKDLTPPPMSQSRNGLGCLRMGRGSSWLPTHGTALRLAAQPKLIINPLLTLYILQRPYLLVVVPSGVVLQMGPAFLATGLDWPGANFIWVHRSARCLLTQIGILWAASC